MPTTKPTKREAILDAMLDLVVERGFHDAPMSLVAERSGASAGVIYHYFSSKEEIIQALHEKIMVLKRSSLFAGYSAEMRDKDALIHLWLNAYHFYQQHQREMRFLEQYASAGFVPRPDENPPDENTKAFMKRFASYKKGGVLNDWPPDVIQEMTIGLLERLAARPRKLPPILLREIAEKMWLILKAPH